MQYITKNIDFIYCNKSIHKNNIVLCGDKNYIKYVGVTLTSVLANSNSNEYHFHIFLDDIEDSDLKKLERTAKKWKTNISIYFIDLEIIENFKDNTSSNTHISIATYFRFIAFSVLNGKVDKALYLDSDICVLDDKLKNVFDVTFDDAVAYTICDIKSSVMGGADACC